MATDGVTVLWVVWLVFCCLFGLVGVLAPKSTAIKPMSLVVALGALTFFVWLTDGRLAIFALAGFVVAYASLMLLVMVRTKNPKAQRDRAPRVAMMLLTPALLFGGFLGAGVELGGRWSGATFVVWRAVLGGVLVFAGGLLFAARAIPRPVRPPGEGGEP